MELKEFLVEAKRKGYADNANYKILGDGSEEFVYEEKDFRYRDDYYGNGKFIGEEIVWRKGKVLWGMNYRGIIEHGIDTEEVFKFLRKALKHVDVDKPYRGPEKFIEGDFEYTNKSEGIILDFIGTEKIFLKGKEVYMLNYRGGMIN